MRPSSKGITSIPSHSTLRPLGGATSSPRRSSVSWVARGPLLDDQVLAHVEPAGGELQIGPGGEDLADVLADRLALGTLPGGVVLEHHVVGVHAHDRLDVVRVPRLVVTLDRDEQRMARGRVDRAHAHPIGV